MFGITIKDDDSTLKKVGKGTAVAFIAMAGAAVGSFIVGYSGKKGVNVADRVPVTTDEDTTITTRTRERPLRAAA